MNKLFSIFLMILLSSCILFAQTKSLDTAQNEVKTFANAENFSLIYDESKYVTKAEVKFDIVEKKTPFAKLFKEFGFQITSLFAFDGIDTKPVRTTFCINTRSKKFHFSNERQLTITFDDETIDFGEGNRSTEVKGRKVRETLCWEIDKEIIELLGNTSRFQYKISSVTGNLDLTKLQYFKDYAKLTLIPEK